MSTIVPRIDGQLPEQLVAYIVDTCRGVPLDTEQMTIGFVQSDMLFLGGDGFYELEVRRDTWALHASWLPCFTARSCGRSQPGGSPRAC